MGKDLTGKELGKGICQRKDGIYCARYVDRFGKRKSLYDRNLSNLKKQQKEELRKNITQINVRTNFLLDEWYIRWMDVYKYHVRDNTKSHYEQMYKKHISPLLGKIPLTKITNLDIRSLINKLDLNGCGYETKSKVHIIILDMFNKAMIDDFVFKNPARSIRVERDEITEPRVLSLNEQTDFFNACKGTFYEELFTVAVLTGLRPGELCALRWQDIDFRNRTISVTRTLLYQKLKGDTKKEFHIDPPKTKSSIRRVKFNERCELALKSQLRKKNNAAMKASAKPLLGFEDLLFVTKLNTPICSQIMTSAIKRIVSLINENRSEIDQFEKFSGHCFRHTYATRCFEAGVDPKVVQHQLGHASLKTTMDLYTHLLEDKQVDELEKFDNFSDDIFENMGSLKEQRYELTMNSKVVHIQKMVQ